MTEKKITSRIVHKHDTETNWNKATNFIPLKGELIVYDIDSTHDYERVKIGDGVTKVSALPFADDTKVDKISGKGLSTNDYTTDEKNKLAGIATGANKTTVDSSLSTSSTNPVQNKVVTAEINNLSTLVGDTSVSSQITTAIANKVDKVNGKGLSTNDYTTTEKNKLAGIASGAEVNQNAFSNITVGSTTIAADAKTDTLTLVAGNNVTITPDATNDKVTIAATDTVYSHPTYTAKSSGLYKVTVDGTGHVSGTTAVAKSDITALGIPAQDTTYNAATTSASGLMSSSDKSKLDGIATGANKTVVDSALSSTSTNPVQNKAVNAAISNLNTLVGDASVSEQISTAISSKSDVGHTHTASEVGADASGSAASALSSAKSYTDTKISNLINGAPTTLDTLGEIAEAMEENADVVSALETAIGTKANTTDLTSHTGNKSNPHGVTVSQIGAVPTSRTVNGKALSANVTLTASDVGADTSGAASSALTTAKAYTDAEITEWVGDATVSEQITTAIAGKSDSGHTHSNYASTVNITGTGNAITAISQSGNTITATKGNTFLTAHPTISKSTDSTSTASPTHGGTFTAVDSITRDSNGHVTKVNTKTITLPADNNTDTKVTQTATSSNASYPLLLAPSGQTSTTTTTSYFDSGVTLNPSTNTIAANVSGNAATATKATSDGSGNNIINTYATKTALSAVETLVGDTKVSTQISEAIANKSDVGHTHSAYVNQNAFSNVVVGSTTVAADSATDTLTLVAGNNVTLTPDATNDKITIAATDTIYTHPSYTARTGVPTANQTPAFGGTFTVSQPVSDSTGHVTAVNSRTITIPSTAATTSAAGLMSAADKTKLDGIETGANKITVDTALSSTSTNPVQNKVVNAAIASLNTLVGDTAVSTQISDAVAKKADLANGQYAVTASSSDGVAYTATVTGITALTTGVSFIMIPGKASASTTPTLNVNGLGAKTIRRRVTNATTSTATGYAAAWLSANKPIEVIYDGTYWIANLPKPSAADMSGTLPISNGGTGATTASAALANLYGIPKTQNVTDSGEDLDNYTTTGVYFFASSYTPTNIPGGSNGWLVVLNQTQADSSSAYVKQIWLRAGTPNSNDYHMWVRTKYTSGGDWGNWYKILTNVLTSNEYGTALPTAGTKGRIFLKKVSS